jgi:hypothetical protein
MTFDSLPVLSQHPTNRDSYKHLIARCLVTLIVVLGCLLLSTPSALAELNDDHFDGNIFALYAGNGSLVPPRVTLADSIKAHKPALLVFYIDDSTDCKKFSTVVSQLQAPYGRAASFIPVSADTLYDKPSDDPMEPGYYYEGLVPQTVLIDQEGEVRLNETGQVSYEKVDDVFREVFDLLPRSESPELKRRPINEINTELSQD